MIAAMVTTAPETPTAAVVDARAAPMDTTASLVVTSVCARIEPRIPFQTALIFGLLLSNFAR